MIEITDEGPECKGFSERRRVVINKSIIIVIHYGIFENVRAVRGSGMCAVDGGDCS